MGDYWMPPNIPALKRWLGIRQGQGAGYYRGLKKAQLQAIYYKEIAKHKAGGCNEDKGHKE
jgi:hypothetical protein